MSDEGNDGNTVNLEDGDFNLNVDDYSYEEAIELFNITKNDNMMILNNKYNALRNLYTKNEEYLNFIDELYLKILNENEEDFDGDGVPDNTYDEEDLSYIKTNAFNNITDRQSMNLNNSYNQQFAVNQINPKGNNRRNDRKNYVAFFSPHFAPLSKIMNIRYEITYLM